VGRSTKEPEPEVGAADVPVESVYNGVGEPSNRSQNPERGGAVTSELLKCPNIRIISRCPLLGLEGIDNDKQLA